MERRGRRHPLAVRPFSEGSNWQGNSLQVTEGVPFVRRICNICRFLHADDKLLPVLELHFLQLQGLLWFLSIQIGPSQWTIAISSISLARPICPYHNRGAGSFVNYKLFLMFIDGLIFGKGLKKIYF